MISFPGLLPLPTISSKKGIEKPDYDKERKFKEKEVDLDAIERQNQAFVNHVIENTFVINQRYNIVKDYLDYLDKIVMISKVQKEDGTVDYQYTLPLCYDITSRDSDLPGISLEHFYFAKDYIASNVNFFVLNAIDYLLDEGVKDNLMSYIKIIYYQKDNSVDSVVSDVVGYNDHGYFVIGYDGYDYTSFKISSTLYSSDNFSGLSKNLFGLGNDNDLKAVSFLSKWNEYIDFIRKDKKPKESFEKNKDLFTFIYNVTLSICNVSIKVEDLQNYVHKSSDVIIYTPGYSVSNGEKVLSLAVAVSTDMDMDYKVIEEELNKFD
ncbi:MAG: hypothetical protein QXF12_06490, partial [Candidatus Aenigmatarchaeota archaeon]